MRFACECLVATLHFLKYKSAATQQEIQTPTFTVALLTRAVARGKLPKFGAQFLPTKILLRA